MDGELNTGERNDVLGTSYIQFAMQGLRHQMSQGAANLTVDPGDRFTFYKLVDSVIPSTVGKDGHEKSFFDGIDTSLPALAPQGEAFGSAKTVRRNHKVGCARQQELRRETTARPRFHRSCESSRN